MPIGNIGSRGVQSYIALDQNERANSNQDMREEDWRKDQPIRDVSRQSAENTLSAMDADAVSYGDKYGYAMELKNRNDQKRNLAMLTAQNKAMASAAKAANLSAPNADTASVQYGLTGAVKDLSTVALHTSGSKEPNGAGFYQVGPMQYRPIQHANMTEKQRQDFDRIQENRKSRVEDGTYSLETFADGVKKYVNKATGNIFRDDVWVEDPKGGVYSSEHINMVTGQSRRAGENQRATTKSSDVPTTSSNATTSATPSTTTNTSTSTTTNGEPEPISDPMVEDSGQPVQPETEGDSTKSVSYTHLTLPTICSV